MIAEQNSLSNEQILGNPQHSIVGIAWGVAIAGAVISLSYEILLNFLGVGLGLSSLNLNSNSMFNTGIGAIIWLIVSGIISMFIGGWFTGKFSNIKCKYVRGCYGILAWSIATLGSIMITAAGAGAFVGGTANVIKNSATTISQITSANKASIGDIANTALTANKALNSESQNNDVSKNAADTGREITESFGKLAIAMFIGFLLSGIASILGAILANPINYVDNTKEYT